MKHVLICATLTLVLTTAGRGVCESSKIHSNLISALEENHEVSIIVSFVGGNTAAIQQIKNHSHKSRVDKITSLKSLLENHALNSQRNVRKYLDSLGVHYKSFWISNQIHVKKATAKIVEKLELFPEVEDVRLEAKISFPAVKNEGVVKKVDDEILWNIQKIKADQAWRNVTNGTGAVVGIIDSGARATHEALRDSFRGVQYGWFDSVRMGDTPYDDLGHGTHVTGTIAGSKGIGVAPGAEWMSCNPCPRPEDGGDCDQAAFIICTEWMLCPTRPNGTDPDCSKAPNVVSNSWGYDPGATTFEPIISAWVAADIVPVFAAGNARYRCEIILSPGDIKEAISVGSTDVNDYIAELSSYGPATNHDEIKPEICAPGDKIVSAANTEDNRYHAMSGTSMATPHLAGVVALIISANPNMTVADVRKTLFEDGVDTNLRFIDGRSCAGIPDNVFPNYIFGYGRVNALKAVNAARGKYLLN